MRGTTCFPCKTGHRAKISPLNAVMEVAASGLGQENEIKSKYVFV